MVFIQADDQRPDELRTTGNLLITIARSDVLAGAWGDVREYVCATSAPARNPHGCRFRVAGGGTHPNPAKPESKEEDEEWRSPV